MATNDTATIGFEGQIWAAADILRGNMDAAEYKHVVLGLIFLKYISDKFDERYLELKADDDDLKTLTHMPKLMCSSYRLLPDGVSLPKPLAKRKSAR